MRSAMYLEKNLRIEMMALPEIKGQSFDFICNNRISGGCECTGSES